MFKAKDILFVIAAGNNAVDLAEEPKYTACYYHENSLVVAIDEQGQLYATSNYGGSTDIAAPGSSILSTYLEDNYICAHGTSAATPFVSAYNSGCGKTTILKLLLEDLDASEEKIREVIKMVDMYEYIESLPNQYHLF